MLAGINEWVKMTVVFMLWSKMGKWVIFRAKINIFGNFFKSFLLNFSEVIPDGSLIIWIFKKWDMYGPKIPKIQKFEKNMFFKFSKILCDEIHSKGTKSDCFFFIFQDNFNYTQITPS